MDKGKRKNAKNSYTIYILIGALYVLIKIAFVLAGYLHPGAILHGLIPGSFTVVAGLLALTEHKKSTGIVWHKIIMVLPVLIFIMTPIYMFIKEKEDWLINGRLEVLIIYEVMAVIQFLMALNAKNK